MLTISFNSYKGGSCRTTTCYNTIPFLADKLKATSHNPIIVFDFDLDSMGLTNLLDKSGSGDRAKREAYSARNLFVEKNDDIKSAIKTLDNVEDSYFENYEKVGYKFNLSDNGAVLFCGANKNSPTLTDNDAEMFQQRSPLSDLVTALRGLNEEDQPRALIFDCAAGIQMTTAVVLSLVEEIIVCMRPSLQARIGTFDYLSYYIPQRIAKSQSSSYPRTVYLVPTSVSQLKLTEDELKNDMATNNLRGLRSDVLEAIEKGLIRQIKGKGELALRYKFNYDMAVEDETKEYGIREVERFKWEECLIYKMPNLIKEEQCLLGRYQKLADIVTKG